MAAPVPREVVQFVRIGGEVVELFWRSAILASDQLRSLASSVPFHDIPPIAERPIIPILLLVGKIPNVFVVALTDAPHVVATFMIHSVTLLENGCNVRVRHRLIDHRT